MAPRDHERYAEDLPPYVLGALPPLEAEALEKHLHGCGECQRELAELRTGAEVLARSVEQIEAPASLRARLLEELAGETDAPRAEAPADAADAPPPADEAGRPRRESDRGRGLLARLRSGPALWPRPAFGALAVGLVAVVTGVAGWALGAAEDDRRTLAANVDRDRLPGASARLTLTEDGENPVLHLSGLRNLGPERSYEVWVQRDGELTPGPLFSPTADGEAILGVPGDAEDIEGVTITRERAAGARTPSETPVVSVPVPS